MANNSIALQLSNNTSEEVQILSDEISFLLGKCNEVSCKINTSEANSIINITVHQINSKLSVFENIFSSFCTVIEFFRNTNADIKMVVNEIIDAIEALAADLEAAWVKIKNILNEQQKNKSTFSSSNYVDTLSNLCSHMSVFMTRIKGM